MNNQIRRSRVLAAVAAVAVLSAGCGDAGEPTAAGTPTPSFDQSTVRACGYARTAAAGEGEKSAAATRDALSAAELSDVAALRQIAAKYAPDGSTAGNITANAGALRIHTWCIDHGLTRPGG